MPLREIITWQPGDTKRRMQYIPGLSPQHGKVPPIQEITRILVCVYRGHNFRGVDDILLAESLQEDAAHFAESENGEARRLCW